MLSRRVDQRWAAAGSSGRRLGPAPGKRPRAIARTMAARCRSGTSASTSPIRRASTAETGCLSRRQGRLSCGSAIEAPGTAMRKLQRKARSTNAPFSPPPSTAMAGMRRADAEARGRPSTRGPGWARSAWRGDGARRADSGREPGRWAGGCRPPRPAAGRPAHRPRRGHSAPARAGARPRRCRNRRSLPASRPHARRRALRCRYQRSGSFVLQLLSNAFSS